MDETTGNLLEDVSEEEAEQLRSFFDATPQKFYSKDEAVCQIGTVNRCITCVVSGSLSARNKVLSGENVNVRRVDAGGCGLHVR